MEPMLAAEPIESSEATEPTEPIDKIDPPAVTLGIKQRAEGLAREQAAAAPSA